MNRKLDITPDVEEAARKSVDALFHLHNEMGPGLLESVYASCLEEEFKHRGIRHAREAAIPLNYRSRRLDVGFRADFIVADKVLLELKAVDALLPVHQAQTITYLKLTGLQLGLLVNLNVSLIKDGIRRLFRECFQTRFVILSGAKDPRQRRPYRERTHGFFTLFRMTGNGYLLGLKTLPNPALT